MGSLMELEGGMARVREGGKVSAKSLWTLVQELGLKFREPVLRVKEDPALLDKRVAFYVLLPSPYRTWHRGILF